MKVWIYVSEDDQTVHRLKDQNEITTKSLSFPKWLFLSIYAIKGGYDVIHFQYLQNRLHQDGSIVLTVLKSIIFLINLLLMKLLGLKIVWTVHHTKSHEVVSSKLDWIGRQSLLLVVNHTILLEAPVVDLLKNSFYIRSDLTVVPLGNYRQLHIERGREGDDAIDFTDQGPVLSMIGHLREYKRIPLGIQSADQSIANGMLIAGKPATSEVRDIILKCSEESSTKIHKHLNFVSDKGMVMYAEESDAVLVLNDQDTVPATALLSASCRTPIVTTPGGVKEYLVKKYEIGIVAESEDKQDIIHAINHLLQGGINPDWELFDDEHDWERYTETHMSIYRDVV